VTAVRALIVLLVAAVSCSGVAPRPRHTEETNEEKPVHTDPPPPVVHRHSSHEHPHGAHPHASSDHHHHPHPHPHLAGVNHHHPY
jgi:hypothetical protein